MPDVIKANNDKESFLVHFGSLTVVAHICAGVLFPVHLRAALDHGFASPPFDGFAFIG